MSRSLVTASGGGRGFPSSHRQGFPPLTAAPGDFARTDRPTSFEDESRLAPEEQLFRGTGFCDRSSSVAPHLARADDHRFVADGEGHGSGDEALFVRRFVEALGEFRVAA